MTRFQLYLLVVLVVIVSGLALIAAKLPAASVRAQGGGPLPVVIVDPNPFAGECPGVLRNCAKVDQGGALRVVLYR